MNISFIILLLLILNVFSQQTIIDFINGDASLSTFAALINQTGLTTLLETESFTVWAPDNDAFSTVPSDILDEILQNPDLLRFVLEYHLSQPPRLTVDFTDPESFQTFNGQNLTITFPTFLAQLIDTQSRTSDVSSPDNFVDNGYVNIINRVLLPIFPVIETTTDAPNIITTINDNEPTTTSLSLPEQNRRDIEELERRVTALERELEECNCNANKGKGNGNTKKGFGYRQGYKGNRRIFDKRSRRDSFQRRWFGY